MSEDWTETGFLLRNLMEHMTDHIYFKDLESRFLMVNQAFLDWTGLTEADVLGRTDFDLFASAHAEQAYEDERRVIRTGEPIVGLEEKETWEDGRITWVSSTKMPLRDAEGRIIGTFGVSRDITDHKEAELQAAYYADHVQRIKAEMDEDVRMAAELQKTFFPREYPTFPRDASAENSRVEFLHHHRASEFVSGDFCTLRALSETEVGVFLCDVMGHGVRAALVTALIFVLVEEAAAIEREPGAFLERMNKQLIPMLRQEDAFLYATACYMVYDTTTGRLRHANAGHPVPIRFRGNHATAEWLMADAERRGPALAICDEGGYETFETFLEPGDAVVTYTDGLYEALNENDEEFGEDRLLAAAARPAGEGLQGLFSAMLDAAARFAGETGFDDDVCLIGLKRRVEE